jgi:hypothetical protein
VLFVISLVGLRKRSLSRQLLQTDVSSNSYRHGIINGLPQDIFYDDGETSPESIYDEIDTNANYESDDGGYIQSISEYIELEDEQSICEYVELEDAQSVWGYVKLEDAQSISGYVELEDLH